MRGQEDLPEKLEILLFDVLERLKRLEAKDNSPTETAKTGRKKKDFAYYIRNKAAAPAILAQLHEWIDAFCGVEALVYIQAALDARVFIAKPPHAAAEEEFPGRMGARSMYYEYVGVAGAFEPYTDIIEEARERLIALNRQQD